MKPSWRKPAGVFAILLLIAVWAFVVIMVTEMLPPLPWPLEALFFVAAGLVWILPLKPLLRWMELGRLRAGPDSGSATRNDRDPWRE